MVRGDVPSNHAALASPELSPLPGRHAVVFDRAAREITVTIDGHISSTLAIEATSAIARLLLAEGPAVVTLDLLEVDGFDIDAPVAAIQGLAPAVSAVARIDVLVRRWSVRLAAISALHILGVDFRIYTDPASRTPVTNRVFRPVT